jgi:hypothetical protein
MDVMPCLKKTYRLCVLPTEFKKIQKFSKIFKKNQKKSKKIEKIKKN